MHEHVPGYELCPGYEPTKSPPCGLRINVKCPTCWTTHVRLHHPKRRARRSKTEVSA